MNSCGIVILAAGASTRLGQAKQLLKFKGVSFLKLTVKEAIHANAGPVLVVLGSNAELFKKEIEVEKIWIVENKEWQEGMASSVRHGLKELLDTHKEIDAAIIMLCDQPYINSSVISDLLDKHNRTGKPIVSCNYGETIGPPALFHKSYFPALMALKGDTGARKIIQQHMDDVATVDFPEGQIDIDEWKDYQKLTH